MGKQFADQCNECIRLDTMPKMTDGRMDGHKYHNNIILLCESPA